MGNSDLIASFVAYLRSEKGASENTIANYETDIRKFAEWFAKPLTKVNRKDVQQYIHDLLAKGATARTAARRLASLRQFYCLLLDDGEVTIEPTRNLPVPKQWKTVPRALSQADFERMVNSLGTSWIDVRDRAMLLVFFASGVRESELANLKLPDLELDSGVAKVWGGKGEKDGIVPLNPPAIAALREYIESVRPKLIRKPLPFVFLSRLGRRVSRMDIYNRVREIGQAALGKHVSPHYLRHGFATALIEGGADVRDVQALMRHSSVDTTAIYIHIDLAYLRRIYYASHPRARIAPAQS